MMLTPDRELWACANEMIRQHGRGAAGKAAERMTELKEGGDHAGAEAWMLILERVVDLLRIPTTEDPWH